MLNWFVYLGIQPDITESNYTEASLSGNTCTGELPIVSLQLKLGSNKVIEAKYSICYCRSSRNVCHQRVTHADDGTLSSPATWILSSILTCEGTLFPRKCNYVEKCKCGTSKERFTVSTTGCKSILGKCQLDCPGGLLDFESNLRHLGISPFIKSLCDVFKDCSECNPVGFNCTKCPPFKYGHHCKEDCSRKCKNSRSCDQNGRCICKQGYKGSSCQQKITCVPPAVEPPLQQNQYPISSPTFINYTCPQPYHIVGSAEIHCTDGRWNDNPPQCVMKCPAPLVPENGGVKGIQGNNADVGTSATYFCQKEYNLVGSEVITCSPEGKWSNSPPVCVKLKLCSDPGTVLNAQREERIPVKVTGNNFPVDSVLIYTCRKGFFMDGDSAVTCQEDEMWSSNLPKCFKVAEINVTCYTKGNELTDEVGIPVRINCPPGCVYKAGGVWGTVIYSANSSVCSAAIHSEKIENIGGPVYIVNYGKTGNFLGSNINGIFSKSSSQRSNSFKLEKVSLPESDVVGHLKGCPSAWHQVGEQCILVTEDHKTWDTSQNICKNMDSSLVVLNGELTEQIRNIMVEKGLKAAWIGLRRNLGKFKWSGTSEEATSGSWAAGEPREDCAAIVGDGQWKTFQCSNKLSFICLMDLMAKKKATCSLPEPILNGKMQYHEMEGKVFEGVTIVFRCDQYHEMIGTGNITCTEGGEWSHPPPQCVKVPMCGEPPSPQYGGVEISTSQTVALSRSALSGNSLDAGPFRTQTNARNNLSSGKNITLPDGFYPVGSLASYRCLSRYYKLLGSKTRRCQVDGTWSGRAAICIPVCGRSDSKRAPFILNGNATEIGQWPWQIGLGHFVAEYNVWFIFCGGALLNENWVITAAHCVTVSGTTTVGSPDNYRVYLGKYYRDDKKDDNAVQISKVKEIHVHPDFDPHLFDADIALLQLDKPATLTSRVQPVCLPSGITTRQNLVEGSLGVVTGWGLTENNSYAQHLQQAVLPVVSHKECEKGYEEANLPLTVTENMYCAGVSKSTVDICSGDSGGPMVFPDDDRPERRWILEGIVSWGSPSGCGFANQYGGFTKVNNYISWIQKFV